MNAATVTFLLIGGLGIALLAVSLFLGDVLTIGHPDANGPFSVPSVAGFLGAFGFGGAIAATLTGGGVVSIVVALIAGVLVAIPAAWGTMALGRLASRMRTDATPTRTDLVGRLGVVVTPIPPQWAGNPSNSTPRPTTPSPSAPASSWWKRPATRVSWSK
jgi:hypothetical protein